VAPADPRDPRDPGTRALLRRAVVEHARTERRRVHPPALHLGTPGRRVARLDLADLGPGHADPGLRADVVAALRVQARPLDADALVWLTRTGGLERQDVDGAWLLAARTAYAEAGVAPPLFVVVDRRGWRDPVSDAGRTWTRVRVPAGG
jgi:hypothetical protein